MERDQEMKFVCKLCYKKYPCGKSLGGHMRSHLIANPAEAEEKQDPGFIKFSSLKGGENFKDSKFEICGQSGYGLRENPRKTWRAEDLKSPLQQTQVCKQCGKGFQSLKALCGHMACHSEKERFLKDDHSWTSENQKLERESHSDSEAEGPKRPKRAATMRYKRASSFVNGGSSCVSEIDHEQEEVAMCLIMLSKDSSNWVSFNSNQESSDSVVLETKSSSIDMKIGRKHGWNCVHNGDEAAEIKKIGKGKLKVGDFNSETARFENSDSGYFTNGAKRVHSDESTDEYFTTPDFKKQKVEGGSSKKLNNGKPRGTELGNGFCKEKECDENGIDSKIMKFDSKNKKKKQKVKKDLACNAERRSKSKKCKAHECPFCHKVFKSGQALGGHKRSHLLGNSEAKINKVPIIKAEISEKKDFLDLNLPAPEEEEENEQSQFMPW